MKNGRVVEAGVKRWYKDDVLHRLDAPAVIYPNGRREWYIEGERHRLNGPALIRPDGFQVWYVEGWRHRQSGPAVIWAGGRVEWWIDGEEITHTHLSAIGLTDYPADGFTDEQVSMLRLMR